ncbi:MAG: hypothetical protein M3169_08465 [Candidatus Eremiobacteraeota bacterium]|nr:hypothetical protein [Candidatus Eremiobacteraeota bacterium]
MKLAHRRRWFAGLAAAGIWICASSADAQIRTAGQPAPTPPPIVAAAPNENAVPALAQAVAAVRAIDDALAAGEKPRAGELQYVEKLLEIASSDKRTYAPTADDPSNAHGVILTGISLGRFVYMRGNRNDAFRAWSNVVRTQDRVEPVPAQTRALRLFFARRYRESFAAFAPWRTSLGFSPDRDDGGAGRSYFAGLDAAARGRWNDARVKFAYALRGSNADFRDAHLALGEVYQLTGRHRAAVTEWLAASALANSGVEPAYTNLTIDGLRLLLHYR